MVNLAPDLALMHPPPLPQAPATWSALVIAMDLFKSGFASSTTRAAMTFVSDAAVMAVAAFFCSSTLPDLASVTMYAGALISDFTDVAWLSSMYGDNSRAD